MFMKLALVLAALSATWLVSPVAAKAQSRFDCHALLRDTGFVNSKPLENGLLLSWQGPFQANDPVSVDENLDRAKPFLRTHLPDRADEASLGCQLIIVEFFATAQQEPNELSLIDWAGSRIPILLVRTFRDKDEAIKAEEEWARVSYRITARFKERTMASPGRFYVWLVSERIVEPRYLGLAKNKSDASRVLKRVDAPEDVRIFLDSAGVKANAPIFVLCGAERTCEELKSFVCSSLDEAVKSGAGSSFGTVTVPRNQDNACDEGQDEQAVTNAAEGGETEDIQNLNTHIQVTTEPVIRYLDGTTALTSDVGIETRECIVTALGGDVFVDTPRCVESAAGMETLAALNARIQIESDDRWVIVEGAAIEAPERVILDIPKGFVADDCLFALQYTDRNGNEVVLELGEFNLPDGGTAFGGTVTTPFQIIQGVVRATLVNTNAAGECPIDEQPVTLSPKADLKIALEAPNARPVGLAHLFLVNGDDLREGLGLSADDAAELARKSVDAVQAAHFRVSQTNESETWSLAEASLGVLASRGDYDQWLHLSREDLRKRVQRAFRSTIPFRDTLPRNRAVVDAASLEAAIAPIKNAATEAGLAELKVTLISHVNRETSFGEVDLCEGAFFGDALSRLNARPGVQVSFDVFSLFKLPSGGGLVLTNRLQPRGLSVAALGEGGAYTCTSVEAGLTLHPFIIEPWRDSVDVASRFSAALSDQLALIIENAVSGSGAF